MKDYIIYKHPILGDYSLNGLIKELEDIYNNSIRLEQELINSYSKLNYNQDGINQFIYHFNVSSRIKCIFDILNDDL